MKHPFAVFSIILILLTLLLFREQRHGSFEALDNAWLNAIERVGFWHLPPRPVTLVLHDEESSLVSGLPSLTALDIALLLRIAAPHEPYAVGILSPRPTGTNENLLLENAAGPALRQRVFWLSPGTQNDALPRLQEFYLTGIQILRHSYTGHSFQLQDLTRMIPASDRRIRIIGLDELLLTAEQQEEKGITSPLRNYFHDRIILLAAEPRPDPDKDPAPGILIARAFAASLARLPAGQAAWWWIGASTVIVLILFYPAARLCLRDRICFWSLYIIFILASSAAISIRFAPDATPWIPLAQAVAAFVCGSLMRIRRIT